MAYFVSVREVYKVTIYSRAGANPNQPYNLYYSEDQISWTLASGPLSSTTCAQQIIVDNGSGTIYLKAEDDSTNGQIYIRGANSSTCPANLDVTCTYSRSVTANSDVAITVYVDGNGDYRSCT
jgi:hypothetical protein